MNTPTPPRKPRTPEEIFSEIDSLKSKTKELKRLSAETLKAHRAARKPIRATIEKIRLLKIKVSEMRANAAGLLKNQSSTRQSIKEAIRECLSLYEDAREMGFRRPRTSDQHAKNRNAIAAKVAAKARAAGREPGKRGRPPRKCHGCGLAAPKAKGAKCTGCGAGPNHPSKKSAKKTCAK